MADSNQVFIPQHEYSMTRPTSRSPSRRNPAISTHFSDADDIERGLEKYRHRVWGFVIYRCTYASDTEWTECVRIVRSALSSILEFYGGLDLLESNPFTIFEDRSIFERAPAAVIRDHFESWAASACLQEQGTSYGSHWWVGSPRYRFCIQITEENLRNILDDKNDADENDGQVRLIRRSWKAQQGDDHERASDPVNILDEYTGVEGCTAYDVGWMNIRQNEYLSFYCRFQNSNIWQARYERPPLLAKVDGI